jgi:hypothetical protein
VIILTTFTSIFRLWLVNYCCFSFAALSLRHQIRHNQHHRIIVLDIRAISLSFAFDFVVSKWLRIHRICLIIIINITMIQVLSLPLRYRIKHSLLLISHHLVTVVLCLILKVYRAWTPVWVIDGPQHLKVAIC